MDLHEQGAIPVLVSEPTRTLPSFPDPLHETSDGVVSFTDLSMRLLVVSE